MYRVILTEMCIVLQESETVASPAAPARVSKRERKHEDDDDDGNWTVDVSEEAVRARMQGTCYVSHHRHHYLH